MPKNSSQKRYGKVERLRLNYLAIMIVRKKFVTLNHITHLDPCVKKKTAGRYHFCTSK